MPPPAQAISWVLACPLHSYAQAALLMTVSSVKPFKDWTWGSWKLFHHDSVSRSHHTSTYSLSMHSLAPFRQGHEGHTNATRRNRNVRYYLSSNKMVWLHFHSLLALSRVRGTLVFLPYIKVIAVLHPKGHIPPYTAAWWFLQLCYTRKTGFITLAPESSPTCWAP